VTSADNRDFRYKLRVEDLEIDWDTRRSGGPHAEVEVSGPIISGGDASGARRLEVKLTFGNADGAENVRKTPSVGGREFVVPLHPSQQDLVLFMARQFRSTPVTVNVWRENGCLNAGMNFRAPGEVLVGEIVVVGTDQTYEIPPGTYEIPIGQWWCGAEHYFDGSTKHLRSAYRAPRREPAVSSPKNPVISELLVTFDYLGRYEAPRPRAYTSNDTIMLYLGPDQAFDGVLQNILRQRDPEQPAMTAQLVVEQDGVLTASIYLEPMGRWARR
jgi:hypothetical protein